MTLLHRKLSISKTTSAILLIYFITNFNSLFAQLPAFKTYTYQQNGLMGNSVRAIFQDSKGFIWIGTTEGVSRYNGYQFENYSPANGLSEGQIYDITEENGKILVGNFYGYIDCIENGKVTNLIKLPKNFTHFARLPDRPLMALTNGGGFYLYKNNKFIKPDQETDTWQMTNLISLGNGFNVGHNLQSIFVVTDDIIPWIDTLINGGRFVIENLYRDSKKRLWACTGSGLLEVMIDLKQKKISLISPPPEFFPAVLAGLRVWSVSEDESGAFWISTTKGVIFIKPGESYKLFREPDGLPSALVLRVFRDREKNIWLGSAAGLVKVAFTGKLDYIQIPIDRLPTGIPFIYSILPLRDGNLLFSNTKLQVYHTKSDSFSYIFPNDSNSYNYFVSGTSPIIFYDARNISYFDSIKKKLIPIEPIQIQSGSQIPVIAPNSCVDKQGNVFIGQLQNIIAVSENKKWMNQTIPEWIWSMTIDQQGYLWVGTMTNASQKRYLYRVKYSFEKDSLVFIKKDYSELVKHNQVRKLLTDKKGNIWAGTTSKGIFCLTPKGEEYVVKVYDQSAGLISNYITSIAETEKGDILVGTTVGIDKLIRGKNGFSVFNIGKVMQVYGTVTAMALAAKDQWWAVVNYQLVKFEDAGYEKMSPLPVEFLSVQLGRTQDSISIKKFDTLISLRHKQNLARFEFSAASFINEKQILYSYRLLGTNDTTWSVPQNEHIANYSSLQPGNYVFEVRTIGWNGEPGTASQFHFSIQKPFWKTGWFTLAVFALLAGFFYWLYRYRVSQLKRVQQVRNRIATDLHDEIGSTLTNISILTELSKRSKSEPEKSQVYLDRIREEIDSSGQALDDIIWSVNSRNDTFHETAARMRRYAAELFDAGNVRYELTLDPHIAQKKIIMEQRRDLFLMYKEVLNNIHKHAAASAVFISLFVEREKIRLIVGDDGKGFDTSKNTHRNGLANIKERVSRWKGGMIVESGNGKGTVIQIQLPLSGVTQKRD
jgi:signal transduction histidine kinase/ligand-binding sensor domain-containing protein